MYWGNLRTGEYVIWFSFFHHWMHLMWCNSTRTITSPSASQYSMCNTVVFPEVLLVQWWNASAKERKWETSCHSQQHLHIPPSDLISRCGFACRCALTESHSLTWLSSFKEKEDGVDRQGSRLINTLSVAAERSLGLEKKEIKLSYSLFLLRSSEHWVSFWSCITSSIFSHSQVENQSSFLSFHFLKSVVVFFGFLMLMSSLSLCSKLLHTVWHAAVKESIWAAEYELTIATLTSFADKLTHFFWIFFWHAAGRWLHTLTSKYHFVKSLKDLQEILPISFSIRVSCAQLRWHFGIVIVSMLVTIIQPFDFNFSWYIYNFYLDPFFLCWPCL